MASLSDLAAFAVPMARSEFMRRIEKIPASRYARAEAARRLESRLGAWTGTQVPGEPGRIKDKLPSGSSSSSELEADEAELVIVHALAATKGDAQFTVSPNGAVSSTISNGWTINKGRIYISGLSPVIDDAASLLNQLRDLAGGRMFFTREHSFIDAATRRAFLRITS